ncbi:MAG: flagellar transcriptional regulator FlhD [Methylomonas sp.]|jgi:hypothetical protein|uniref:flagellar transcriptional regulator FlhD n=1 Tax=Methylomonas TaxID=416 RepID=UPI0025F2A4E8|nr:MULTISPECIES: flagellar transcriptional regulator FlhD [Methylomonas]MCK9608922.1 flagellar transcriptional regulator FlhD [Methylomonas sp.]WKJ90233.1 flagellar transcriptional regulator FlhD [Methylomonas montana]
MDDNLYNLNLDYLLVAKEMIATGDAHKAQFYLGLPAEAIEILRNMTTKQMKALAGSDYLKFCPRFNPSHWREFMETQTFASESPEHRAKELLMILAQDGSS